MLLTLIPCLRAKKLSSLVIVKRASGGFTIVDEITDVLHQ